MLLLIVGSIFDRIQDSIYYEYASSFKAPHIFNLNFNIFIFILLSSLTDVFYLMALMRKQFFVYNF